MNKALAAVLTGALAVGATATTFAAANPFSDVPAGHWAYSSVNKLAAEGVIEGYGDGTFLGNRNITRYEMAQMIAKAMAKNPTGATKAELDKLASEFRSELDSLGVRVDELEKHSDKVQWTGEVRYRYWYDKLEGKNGASDTKNMRSRLELRLFPSAEINENWTARARITALENFREDSTGDAKLTYIYAEGKYRNFEIDLGKMPLYSNADSGLVADDFFSGARLIIGNKVKFNLEGGRWSKSEAWTKPADYVGTELLYDNGTLNAGASYRYFKAKGGFADTGKDKASVWSVGAGYKFGGGIKLSAAYAENTKADKYKRGYNIELAYKGANKNEANSWGVFAAYRYVGKNVGFAPTYDVWYSTTNKKGIEFGATYSPLKNTLTKLSYFQGKTLDTRRTDKQIFGRISWFF